MAKRLQIEIDLDRGPSQAESQKFRADQKKLGEQLLSDAEIVEQAQRELTRRTNAEKIKAAADAKDSVKKARAEEAEAARNAAEAEKRAARDAAEAQKVAARESSQAERQAAREKADASRAAAATAKQLEREKAQAAKDAAATKKTADKEAATAAKQAHAVQMGQWNEQGAAISGLADKLGSFGLQMIGLNSATAVVTALFNEFERGRTSLIASAKATTEYRDSLRELAALKGKLGESTGALKEEVAFRGKTLQTADEARRFQEVALGVGESAIDNAFAERNISREEFRTAMMLGGQFQATEGGDATAHGQLIGMIPTLAKGRMTGEDVFAKESQLFKIFQPGGASFSSLANQFSKLAPLVQSGVYKDTEAAALLSAFSTTNREGAGENVQQFTRATLGGIGRKGMPRVEGAETQGKYLKRLGITEDLVKQTEATRLPFVIADRMSADFAKQEAAARGRGEEFNPYLYLRKEGFANQEDIGAILQYHGLRKSGQLEGTFMPLAAEDQAGAAAEEISTKMRTARGRDPAMQARQAQLAEQLSGIAVGAGGQETLDQLKRTAFARRRARGEESFEKYDEVSALGGFDPSELLFGHRRKTNLEAQRLLIEQADKMGIGLEDIGQRGGLGKRGIEGIRKGEEFGGNAFLLELKRRISAAGGADLPGFEDVQALATHGLERSGRLEEGLPEPFAPPAMGGAALGDAADRAARVRAGGAAGVDAAAKPMTAEQGEKVVAALDMQVRIMQEKAPGGPPPPRIVPANQPPPVARRN